MTLRRCVLFPANPIRGESLQGYLARVTAENHLEKPSELLRAAGLRSPPGSDLSRMAGGLLRSLCKVLQVEEASVHPLLCSEKTDGSREFWGTSIRPHFLLHDTRRVAPSALGAEPFHRALWSVKPLTYCSEAWEVLIETCPTCGKRLGWGAAHGIGVCEHCGLDLRSARATEVEPGLRTELGFAACLINPDGAKRAEALAQVPHALRDLGPGELFELAVTFGRAASAAAGKADSLSAKSSVDAYRELAMGGRMLLTYPDSIRAMADRGENKAVSPVFAGLRRAELSASKAVREALQALAQEHLGSGRGNVRLRQKREAQGKLTLRELARRSRVENAAVARVRDSGGFPERPVRGTERKHAWFSEEEAREFARRLRQSSSVCGIGGLGGRNAIEQFVGLGLIAIRDDPVALAVHPKFRIDRESAHGLETRLRSKAGYVSALDPDFVLIEDLFEAIGARDKPWGPVVAAALEGRLPGGLHSCHSDFADERFRLDFGALMVSADFAAALKLTSSLDNTSPWWFPRRRYRSLPPGNFYGREAQAYLNCYPRDLSWLLANGHIQRADKKGVELRRADVERFGRRYIGSIEIAARFGISGQRVEGVMGRLGIDRALGVFWPRSAFERRLSLAGSAGFEPTATKGIR